ncbi:hypothetical protein E0H26_25275 [Micromonospora zingiberis]|uniref:Uncharacterized protein n=1 Tax=Micromonospora zingiberis TaxID=2053011 RepID=A0A4R0G712_9ACTN|nr:hypothetical protein [Micromonospora zingiberis]TCB91603.1 hypothetical protein E0H26_25275 [Micromonospora zingiberis]
MVMLCATPPATPGGAGWQEWIPACSALIAAAALIVSILNRRTANKALRLSLAQEDRRIARLDLQLMEQISFRPRGADYRWVLAQVLIINRSDRDGSIVKAELRVGYLTNAGARLDVHLPHASLRESDPIKPDVESIKLPALIKANDAISGWLSFKVKNELTNDRRVEEYLVLVHDSRGPVESSPIWAMREIVDEEDQAAEPLEANQGREDLT